MAEVTHYFTQAHDNTITTIQKKFGLKRSAAQTLIDRAISKLNKKGAVLFQDSKYFDEAEVTPLIRGHKLYGEANVPFYIDAVYNWSMKRNTPVKRTDRGWLATIRDFMRGDAGKNTLVVRRVEHGGFRNL